MYSEIYLHDVATSSPNRQDLLIFFVTGNPGVVEYYRTFLTHLYGTLLRQCRDPRHPVLSSFNLHVYGRNLAGYGTRNCRNNFDDEEELRKRLPLGLQDQIEYVEKALYDTVQRMERDRDRPGGGGGDVGNGSGERDFIGDKSERHSSKPVQVILIGHSLGTYINLELLRRYNERKRLQNSFTTGSVSPSKDPPGETLLPCDASRRLSKGNDAIVDHSWGSLFHLVGIAMLAPTICDLRASPSGNRLTIGGWATQPFSIRSIFRLARIIGSLINFGARCFPTSTLAKIIELLGRMPADGARITAEFLQSPLGVTQALYLARDELREITIDKWDDEVWGTTSPTPDSTLVSSFDRQAPPATVPLYFLFARSDHWIADHTRAALIRSRAYDPVMDGDRVTGKGRGKPHMEIDEEIGMCHAFCLTHSIPVAEKVASYVLDALSRRQ